MDHQKRNNFTLTYYVIEIIVWNIIKTMPMSLGDKNFTVNISQK